MGDLTRIIFEPSSQEIEVREGTKLLVASKRADVALRFGCASCRCGTCAVKISSGGECLQAMKDDERELLAKMELETTGTIRLACRARTTDKENGVVVVDVSFQDEYEPIS